jgi:hypothetical protein
VTTVHSPGTAAQSPIDERKPNGVFAVVLSKRHKHRSNRMRGP